MATLDPVEVTDQWTLVYDGDASGIFTGAIQNLGGTPLVGRVTLAGVPPEVGAGGFAIYANALPIGIAATEALYVRATGPVGTVIIA
jgi:hypothetical protein